MVVYDIEERLAKIKENLKPGEILKVIDDSVVPGIKPYVYYCTNYGRVFSIYKGEKAHNPVKPDTIGQTVHLRLIGNKSIHRSIYRLVLMIFNPVPGMENMEVGHRDGNPTNNRLDNLFWRDGSYLRFVNNDSNPFVDFSKVAQPEDIIILPVTEFQVPGVKPNYFVSNAGNVYSISGSRNREVFKMRFDLTKGYNRVLLHMQDQEKYPKGKHIQVHRLVLLTFRYRPDYDVLLVNHKDRNTTNNYVDPYGITENDNIEWCTPMYNSNYMIPCGSAFNQMRAEQVIEILDLLKQGIPVKDIAAKYNVGVDCIYGIRNGKTYKAITGGGLQQWQI